MVAIAGSISVATVVEKKGAGATNASVQAFQVADGGLQKALSDLGKAKADPASTGDINNVGAFASCGSGDVVVSDQPLSGAKYTVSFYKGDITVSTNKLACSAKINEIKNIKVVGTYKNTVRAVSVAVSPWIVSTACQVESDSTKNLYVYNSDLETGPATGIKDTKAWAENGEDSITCDTNGKCDDAITPGTFNLKEDPVVGFGDYPAQDACNDTALIDDGGRLPTKTELDCIHKTATNALEAGDDFGAYGNYSFDDFIYYTSTQSIAMPTNQAIAIDFNINHDNASPDVAIVESPKSDSHYVRCVRSSAP